MNNNLTISATRDIRQEKIKSYNLIKDNFKIIFPGIFVEESWLNLRHKMNKYQKDKIDKQQFRILFYDIIKLLFQTVILNHKKLENLREILDLTMYDDKTL